MTQTTAQEMQEFAAQIMEDDPDGGRNTHRILFDWGYANGEAGLVAAEGIAPQSQWPKPYAAGYTAGRDGDLNVAEAYKACYPQLFDRTCRCTRLRVA